MKPSEPSDRDAILGALSMLGRLGGSSKTPAKRAASIRNLKLAWKARRAKASARRKAAQASAVPLSEARRIVERKLESARRGI